MVITNELLAAYAEGNVTAEERKAVRAYLTEHPSQLESVMRMMDRDYDLEVPKEKKNLKAASERSRLQTSRASRGISFRGFAPSRGMAEFSCACLAAPSPAILNSYFQLDESFTDSMNESVSDSFADASHSTTFNDRLDDLLDEIF